MLYPHTVPSPMRQELLGKIERYLSGAIGARDLETWLVSHIQIILEADDAEALRIANQVDADLMELGERLIDEAELRDRLEPILGT